MTLLLSLPISRSDGRGDSVRNKEESHSAFLRGEHALMAPLFAFVGSAVGWTSSVSFRTALEAMVAAGKDSIGKVGGNFCHVRLLYYLHVVALFFFFCLSDNYSNCETGSRKCAFSCAFFELHDHSRSVGDIIGESWVFLMF